jgi:hypothetical protein
VGEAAAAVVEAGRDLVLAAVFTVAVALALVAAPRTVAWPILLALAIAMGGLVSRTAGLTAAVAGGLLYMWAHGQPRFSSTITDQTAIRLGFLLIALGAAAVTWAHGKRTAVTSSAGNDQPREGRRPLP